ncbi:uncharacterized protein [Periplaneta americana]|uniref:uncharacterized protein isoform X12 n=1 Tax=Periplaneta americana TaxID=6978 RepID=UPI0037E9B4CF
MAEIKREPNPNDNIHAASNCNTREDVKEEICPMDTAFVTVKCEIEEKGEEIEEDDEVENSDEEEEPHDVIEIGEVVKEEHTSIKGR